MIDATTLNVLLTQAGKAGKLVGMIEARERLLLDNLARKIKPVMRLIDKPLKLKALQDCGIWLADKEGAQSLYYTRSGRYIMTTHPDMEAEVGMMEALDTFGLDAIVNGFTLGLSEAIAKADAKRDELTKRLEAVTDLLDEGVYSKTEPTNTRTPDGGWTTV